MDNSDDKNPAIEEEFDDSFELEDDDSNSDS